MKTDSTTGDIARCEWAGDTALMQAYHDTEWGVPIREDRKLFEYLLLDAFQAGLSWSIILRKREGFRNVFRDFDPEAIARMTDEDLADAMLDPQIIRNRAKIVATRKNAQAFLAVVASEGSFAKYLWSFVGDSPIQNRWNSWTEIPAQTEESRAVSADLKRRGFAFVGPTIIYAVMQSAGLVNDHVVACFRYDELASP